MQKMFLLNKLVFRVWRHYVSINSKLQHAPPGPAPGIWTFWNLTDQILHSLCKKCLEMPHCNQKLSVQMPHLHMKIMKQ
jgi:hypothetical protein